MIPIHNKKYIAYNLQTDKMNLDNTLFIIQRDIIEFETYIIMLSDVYFYYTLYWITSTCIPLNQIY